MLNIVAKIVVWIIRKYGKKIHNDLLQEIANEARRGKS